MILDDQISTLRLLGAIVIAAVVVWLMLSWVARLEPKRRDTVLGWLEVGGFGMMVLLAGLFWLSRR